MSNDQAQDTLERQHYSYFLAAKNLNNKISSLSGYRNGSPTPQPIELIQRKVLPTPWIAIATKPMNELPRKYVPQKDPNNGKENKVYAEDLPEYLLTDYAYKKIRPTPWLHDEYDFTYNRAKPVISVAKYVIPDTMAQKPSQPAVQFQDMYHIDDIDDYKPEEPYGYLQDQNKRREVNRPKKNWANLFRPRDADYNNTLSSLQAQNRQLFHPNNNTLPKYNVSLKVYPQIITAPSVQNGKTPTPLLPNSYKHVTILKPKDIYTRTDNREYNLLLTNDSKIHILMKDPNPYEAVILRFPHTVTQAYARSPKSKPGKFISQINMEHLLKEMEMGSEINKKSQRSMNRRKGELRGQFGTFIVAVFLGFMSVGCSRSLFRQYENFSSSS